MAEVNNKESSQNSIKLGENNSQVGNIEPFPPPSIVIGTYE